MDDWNQSSIFYLSFQNAIFAEQIIIRMRRHFTTICLCAIFCLTTAFAFHSNAQQSAQKTIESLINTDAFSQSVISMCAVNMDGKKIVDINSTMMLVPASNMKLVSTGAAIHKFGPKHRFETSIGYDGEITDGVLNGNVYIIGGGDPTLASLDSIAVSIDKVFGEWTSMLKKEGISRINGHIIGDGRYFDALIEDPSWLIEDVGTYYGTGTTGLMFYENMQSFKVSAGPAVGAAINITPSYPETPWMEFRYNCTTGKEGSGDMLYMFTSELAPVAEIRGTFGVDRKPKRVDCSNKFPEYTCAYYFMKYLKKNGITSCGAGDFRLKKDWNANGDIKIIGKTYSPTLDRVIFETNHISNNVYAETLARTLGRHVTGNACYDSSYVAINKTLAELKIDTTKGYKIKDGSGLSRQNYLSSDFLCRFLRGMMNSPHFGAFVESLPHPGGNGTLQYNMQKVSEDIKARIKVKSGSMNGVRCYSGYIIPSSGARKDVIIFSLMINNCTAPGWKVRNLMDSIMVELAKLN